MFVLHFFCLTTLSIFSLFLFTHCICHSMFSLYLQHSHLGNYSPGKVLHIPPHGSDTFQIPATLSPRAGDTPSLSPHTKTDHFLLRSPIPSKVPMLLSQTALRKKFHSPLSPLRQLLSSLRSLPVPQDRFRPFILPGISSS